MQNIGLISASQCKLNCNIRCSLKGKDCAYTTDLCQVFGDHWCLQVPTVRFRFKKENQYVSQCVVLSL